MKRTLIGAIALLLAAGAVSCSSSKKASGPAAPAGMVEELFRSAAHEYRSNAEYYRAVQNGVSIERSTAQKIAMQNCRQDLAAAIQADVKLVIENYVKNQDTGVSAEHKSQYQELAYTAVGQQLRDVQVVEEKMFRQDNGSFRYYVCMQLPGCPGGSHRGCDLQGCQTQPGIRPRPVQKDLRGADGCFLAAVALLAGTMSNRETALPSDEGSRRLLPVTAPPMKRYLTLLLSLLFVLPLPAQSRREALLEYQARRRQAYTEFRDNYRKACADLHAQTLGGFPRRGSGTARARTPGTRHPRYETPGCALCADAGQDALRQGGRPARAGSGDARCARDCGNTCASRQARRGKAGPGITVCSRGGNPPRGRTTRLRRWTFRVPSSSRSTARAVPYRWLRNTASTSPRCRRTAWPMPGKVFREVHTMPWRRSAWR
ncbi:MAG: hypothetical protein ACLTZY_02910 [Alistipes indistinctus]